MAGLTPRPKRARKRKAPKASPLDDASDALYRYERGVATRPQTFGTTSEDRAFARMLSSTLSRGK